MRRRCRLALFGCALFGALIAGPVFAAKPPQPPETAERIEIRALPFDLDRQKPDRTGFGKLEWRGGLTLSSNVRHFGGFSGLALSPDGGQLLAISDAGVWLTAKIERDGRKLRGLAEARLGPLLALNGKPFARVRDIDAEGLAVEGGHAWIAFEQNDRIMRHEFDWGDPGPGKAVKRVPPPPELGCRRGNDGIETVGMLKSGPMKGRLIVFAENALDRDGGHMGWIMGNGARKSLSLKRIGGFDVTDVAGLPDGGIVVLERRFRYSEGVKMRIRRVSPEELAAKRTIEGEVLLELDSRATIDNMEGIAAHRSADGETILTLISDDNYNRFFQRTLLMQFALKD